MQINALVGKSGTGKSHRAIMVAHDCVADVIIDDGLLIKGDQILVGFSAKKQPTRIGAIKVALFSDPEQSLNAQRTLAKVKPKGILILGTSLGMVKKIAENLGLPPITRIINIEDVATPQEIKSARFMRTKYAKHVIPAPTMEVRKSFHGMLIDPLRVFLKRSPQTKKGWLEQSVVRPTFTYYGRLSISESALTAITSIAAREVRGIKSPGKINILQEEDGLIIEIYPILKLGNNMNATCREIQKTVKKRLEDMTGLRVKMVHVTVKEISIPSLD